MPDINEIIADLNVSIADMETLMSMIPTTQRIHVSRALGQLRAARGCLLVLLRPTFEDYNKMKPEDFKSRERFIKEST